MSDLPSPRPTGTVPCRNRKPHRSHWWDINSAGVWPEHVRCPGRTVAAEQTKENDR